MQRFRDALLDALGRGKRFLLKDIAAAAEIAPERISRWERRPEFRTWLDLEVATAVQRLVNPMHLAQMQIAFHSLPHYQVQLRRLGLENPAVGATTPDGASVNGVQIHIHGIPEREPFSSLPPPLTLSASPAQTPTPAPTDGV